MQYVTFSTGDDPAPRPGAVVGDRVVDLRAAVTAAGASAPPATLLELIRGGPTLWRQAADIAQQALAAREAGRLEESITLYRRVLAARPADPESWWYQGLNYYDLDRYVDAEDAFRKLTELNPKHGGAFALLGLCEFQNRKYKTAFAHLVLAKERGVPPASLASSNAA